MNRATVNEIVRLGGDPADDVWIWFASRGPHGPSFTWGQTRQEPAGFVGVDLLREFVDEMSASVWSFRARALTVVNAAFDSTFPEFVRRAIQVAAVIGTVSEIQRIRQFESSEDPAIASDARACAFHLKRQC
jgi:hypothetical protein